MDQQTWKGKTALVTGASSGIGAAIAQKLANKGMYVILAARRLDRLAEQLRAIRQQGGRGEVLQVDLSQDEERQRLYERVLESHGKIDILVNNAGLGWYGFGAEMPWETAAEMIKVNVEATVQLSLAFLRDMRSRNTGHIINIGSVAGGLPAQGIAVYGATKSFLDSFTAVLYREMQGSRVHVSVVRAGPVDTEFFPNAAARPKGFAIPLANWGISAEQVANRVWQLIQRPRKAIYIPGILAVTPWVETCFGWLIDHMGPLLLHRKSQ